MNDTKETGGIAASVILLGKIQKGYVPAEPERKMLADLQELKLTDSQVRTLEKGADYLTSLQSLTLKNNTINSLPISLGQLTELRRLEIVGPFLKAIPQTIGRLEKLEELTIMSSRIQTLPGSLCQLKRLKKLSLSCSSLRVLPRCFGQLEALETLKVGSMFLGDFKNRLHQLKRLKVLSIICNKLSILPVETGELKSLEMLTLGSKQALYLPDSIGRLDRLTVLRITCPDLRLPAEFGELSALQKLDLDCEHIKTQGDWSGLASLDEVTLRTQEEYAVRYVFSLPNLRALRLTCTALQDVRDIKKLKKLQYLTLISNQMKKLPLSFFELSELKQLHLSCRKLLRLPQELGNLTKLQTLRLDIPMLGALPSSLERLENLKELEVQSDLLTELPPQIGSLAGLRSLRVASGALRRISDKIVQLDHLQILSLGPCALESLPDVLGNLKDLHTLEISSDGLRQIPSSLKTLEDLTWLEVHSKQIDTMPKWIGNLKNLQTLDFSKTGVKNLPDSLARLRGLKVLNLSRTKLAKLPGWIGGLGELEELLIDHTGVQALPAGLRSLSRLNKLDLSSLKLHSLPKELLELRLPFILGRSSKIEASGIFLNDTTLATQPVSLFEQPLELIREYYNAKQIPVNEAKVIFLGDGSVGKTYTIQRMLNNCQEESEQCRYHTTETHGILIKPYHVEQDGRSFDIHFWDFGGQDIMHSMHRCFLTERTCYVVMVSTRTPDLTTGRARYWLRNIESFAHDAPVILAINRWGVDSPHTGLDISRLQQEFPNLVRCVAYSAKSSSEAEFRTLETAIIEQAQQLDSCNMSFPEQWDHIRQELLRQATNATYYIGRSEYHDICDKYGLSKNRDIRSWLLEWFNDLGVCFSYHQDDGLVELPDYKILDPEWLTSAIYRIIFGRGKTHNGTITVEEIRRILREKGSPELEEQGIPCLNGVSYSNEECSYVLDIMRKFKVSYKISEESEFIPALCNENTPKELVPKGRKHWGSVKLSYHYLPDSVVHQLMIATHAYLRQDKCWRKGLYIDWDVVNTGNGVSAGSVAVYMTGSHSEDTELQLEFYLGKKPHEDTTRYSMQVLLALIDNINKTMNLQAEIMVLAEMFGHSEWFSQKKIQKCKERGFWELQGEDENYKIAELERKFGAWITSRRGLGSALEIVETVSQYRKLQVQDDLLENIKYINLRRAEHTVDISCFLKTATETEFPVITDSLIGTSYLRMDSEKTGEFPFLNRLFSHSDTAGEQKLISGSQDILFQSRHYIKDKENF